MFNKITMLASGSFFSQVIFLATMPILTRLYDPNDFGTFAIFMGLVSILTNILTLRFEMVLPKMENVSEKEEHMFLIFSVILIASFFLGVVICIQGFFELKFSFLVLISSVLLAITQSYYYSYVQSEQYRLISISKLIQVIVMFLIQYKFFYLDIYGLIFGYLISHFLLACIYLNFGVRIKYVSFRKFKKLFSKHFIYVKSLFPSSTLNILGQHLPTMFLGGLFSTSSAGNFSLAQRMLNAPSSMLGAAISSVYYSTISKVPDEEVRSITLNLTKILVFISFPIFTLIAIKGPDIFRLLFGEQWSGAGQYATILLPWIMMVFICAPISNLNHFNNRQLNFIKFEALLLSSRIIALMIGGFILKNPLYTIVLFSIVSTLCWVVYFIYLLFLVGINQASAIALLCKGMLVSFLIIVPTLIGSELYLYALSVLLIFLNTCFHFYRREYS